MPALSTFFPVTVIFVDILLASQRVCKMQHGFTFSLSVSVMKQLVSLIEVVLTQEASKSLKIPVPSTLISRATRISFSELGLGVFDGFSFVDCGADDCKFVFVVGVKVGEVPAAVFVVRVVTLLDIVLVVVVVGIVEVTRVVAVLLAVLDVVL